MAEIVYLLCFGTSSLCALLLFRAYRKSQTRLLFWSSLCFSGFALNNGFLFLDIVVFPEVYLSVWRLVPALLGVSALIYGLIRKDA
ncbi:MAG: DUF5985 family protein [Bdellovibrionales bacterium]